MKLTELESRYDIGLVLNALGLNGRGAEIGVAYGQNAKLILDKWKCEEMCLVDPYEEQDRAIYASNMDGVNYEAMLEWSKDHLKEHAARIRYIREYSTQAALRFDDGFFDFVYLDGNHQNPQFLWDLVNWFPKVKKGGIFGGHDYALIDTPTYQCHVKPTVDKWACENQFDLHISRGDPDYSWWVQV